MSIRFLFALLVLLVVKMPLAAESVDNAAKRFIAEHEDDWFNYFSDDIEEAYPFGRCNQKIRAELSKKYDLATGNSKDGSLTNKHFIFDGNWYSVQWFYGAIDRKTGKKQLESTLAFGCVRDGKLIVWREYFDDAVGARQMGQIPGDMPLYETTEEPYPWPKAASLHLPYRP